MRTCCVDHALPGWGGVGVYVRAVLKSADVCHGTTTLGKEDERGRVADASAFSSLKQLPNGAWRGPNARLR